MLNGTLSRIKAANGGVITVVDIAKAFDTVPHGAIEKCLAAKGVPETLINIIKDMYTNSRTTIRAKDNKKVEIKLSRGVKQGDPLSPLIFNLIMDPLIAEIDNTTSGVDILDENVSILAFADDMVLIGKDVKTAQQQLKKGRRISIETGYGTLHWKMLHIPGCIFRENLIC